MRRRRSILASRSGYWAVGLIATTVLCGCEDVDWDWELQEWIRPERPIRPIRPRAPHDFQPHRPRVRTVEEPEPQEERPDAEAAAKQPWQQPSPDTKQPVKVTTPLAADSRSYYNLYLIAEPASLKAPSNSKKIRLQKAKSRPAADVLHQVYPSIGPSGAEGQRFLVYQHEPMWSAASEFVPLLDCPELTEAPSVTPAEPMAAFQAAVGRLYHLKQPGQPTDFDGFKKCTALLASVVESKQASGQLRWGAAILAGRVLAETLSDFAQARARFTQAKGLALPGSIEEMIAGYDLAETYEHEGQEGQAATIARELVKTFTAHRSSCVYERALGLASPK